MRSLAVVVVGLLCLAGSVSGAGPLLAEVLELRSIRSIIRGDEAKEFAYFTGASAAQREAAEQLVDAARTELGRAVNRHLRSVRDDGLTLEALNASEARVIEAAQATERGLLADLRSLLNEPQVASFDRF